MYLDDIIIAQSRGIARGIASLCSSNPIVLEAAFRHALMRHSPLLVESTCNQVNQYGGYMNLKPKEFVANVVKLSEEFDFPRELLILGGDHLGPEVWHTEPAASAMDKASTLVRHYILAGYRKIHLDASMKLADDPQGIVLDKAISAARAATLAETAEAAYEEQGFLGSAPRYVIGTEVPVPGGAQSNEDQLKITTVKDVSETIDITHHAFLQRELDSAWERVIAVVVQPGVEFGNGFIHDYDHKAATHLVRFIEEYPTLVYEAHSTDYQTGQALTQLVADHFAILKVGPALTFAFREALLALERIENELFKETDSQLSRLFGIIDQTMLDNPKYWKNYYPGVENEQRLARLYSLSDRIRYYWSTPDVQQALDRLFYNLSRREIPLTLVSQYLPLQYERYRQDLISINAGDLVLDRISLVLDDYYYACISSK